MKLQYNDLNIIEKRIFNLIDEVLNKQGRKSLIRLFNVLFEKYKVYIINKEFLTDERGLKE